MKTAAKIANDAKVRLQQDIVARLRAGGAGSKRDTWHHMKLNPRLWAELSSYDLVDPARQSHLSKVAFPDANHADVAAALEAGNNLTRLYAVACGRAFVATDEIGRYVRGKKGLKILSQTNT